MASNQVPLIGLADDGIGQHADPVDQEAAVDRGVADEVVRGALHGDGDLVGPRAGEALRAGDLDGEVERSGLGWVPGDDGAGPGRGHGQAGREAARGQREVVCGAGVAHCDGRGVGVRRGGHAERQHAQAALQCAAVGRCRAQEVNRLQVIRRRGAGGRRR